MSIFRCKEVDHQWSFKKTDLGTQRTCLICGVRITDVGRPVFSPLDLVWKTPRIKGKHYKK
jgi:hypothetical protein